MKKFLFIVLAPYTVLDITQFLENNFLLSDKEIKYDSDEGAQEYRVLRKKEKINQSEPS